MSIMEGNATTKLYGMVKTFYVVFNSAEKKAIAGYYWKMPDI